MDIANPPSNVGKEATPAHNSSNTGAIKKGHDARQALAHLNLADRTANHSFFQKQEIKEGLLTAHVKQLILDAPFTHPTLDLDADGRLRKVLTRNESIYKSRTPKEITNEKQIRKQVVQETGFNADPKAPYSALGAPILEEQALLFTTMNLDGRKCVVGSFNSQLHMLIDTSLGRGKVGTPMPVIASRLRLMTTRLHQILLSKLSSGIRPPPALPRTQSRQRLTLLTVKTMAIP